jgi:serine/threonine-protein kinase
MTQLDRALWDRIAGIFDRALDVDGPDRAALLDQLCGSDRTIRHEVEDMLEAHDQSPGLIAERRLVSGPGTLGAAAGGLDGSLPEGARVGAYRVVSPVGAGGMGDVYRAERADGAYRQTVALKVLRPGYRTAEMVRRFRIEREALARLTHPGIATILDGGALDDGRPYLVLELVPGVPVTTYCAERALSIRDRLVLFLRIVNTVQFAHGRLVVHRDLKPSNILVQPDGAPRLLDFGIAKLLDLSTDASLGLATTPEVRLLTPEYAAPEQLRGEPPTTATDIYALGVLLFEMLTGARPFPAAGRTVSALEQAILESPPPAPSSVAPTTAVARQLRGDLDRIVLMALKKEPERRYVSAAQLGDDVERYLAGRPVSARPDSVRYRFGKFVRRNRAVVVGAAAVALLIAGFGTMAAVQARRTARERDRADRERATAEDVLGILTGLFERADPNKHPGGDTLRVTSLLDEAERQVAGIADPPRQAALERAVGRMRVARGEYRQGIALLRSAYEQRRRLFGRDDIEAARIHHEIATSIAAYEGDAPARPLLDSSLTELRRLLGDRTDEVRRATSDLLMVTFDSVAARPLLDRLAELDRTSPTHDPIVIAEELNRRGSERVDARRYDDAAALFRASLDVLHRHLPPEHEDVRTVDRNLAATLYMGGHLDAAERMQRAAIALEERLRGSAITRAMTHEALALTMVAKGRADSAEVHEREALRLFRDGAAPEHWRIWSAQRNLAFITAARGRVAEGLALLDSSITAASVGPGGTEQAGYLVAQRVPFLLRLRRPADASRALAVSEQRLGTSSSVTRSHRADVNRYAAMIDLSLGNGTKAVERLRAAVALSEPPGDTAVKPGLNSCLLGVALAHAGQRSEARPLLDRPCTAYRSNGLPDPLIVQWIVEARDGTGDHRDH